MIDEILSEVAAEGLRKVGSFVKDAITNEINYRRLKKDLEYYEEQCRKYYTLICDDCGKETNYYNYCESCGGNNIVTLELYNIPLNKREDYIEGKRNRFIMDYLYAQFLFWSDRTIIDERVNSLREYCNFSKYFKSYPLLALVDGDINTTLRIAFEKRNIDNIIIELVKHPIKEIKGNLPIVFCVVILLFFLFLDIPYLINKYNTNNGLAEIIAFSFLMFLFCFHFKGEYNYLNDFKSHVIQLKNDLKILDSYTNNNDNLIDKLISLIYCRSSIVKIRYWCHSYDKSFFDIGGSYPAFLFLFIILYSVYGIFVKFDIVIMLLLFVVVLIDILYYKSIQKEYGFFKNLPI